jgi:hypothetical protein
MTSPVISKKDYMAFCLPLKYSIDTAPIPISPKVNIELIPERILAVLRFSGKTNEERIRQYSQKLRRNVEKEKLQTSGGLILFRYNSPFTPGFLRRNEISIELNDFDK